VLERARKKERKKEREKERLENDMKKERKIFIKTRESYRIVFHCLIT